MRAWATALRPAVPLVLAALLGGPLVWRLLTVPPMHPIVEPLVEEPSEAIPNPLRLRHTERTADADVFRAVLASAEVDRLWSVAEIHLTMGTYASAAKLLQASIGIEGTPCIFRTAAGAELEDNTLLAFRRQSSCDATGGSPTGLLSLEVRLARESGRVALWTLARPAEGRLLAGADGQQYVVRGQTLSWPPPPTRPRIGLLAYVWDVTPAVLWARLRTVAVVVVAGLILLQLASTKTRRTTAIASAASGTALLMTGLALAHALLFPPLQAPDEPIHAFSLSDLTGDPELRKEVIALGNRTHFDRLRHKVTERFREIDIDRPLEQRWALDVNPPPAQQRSPVAAWWWTTVASDPGTSAVARLWALRRANAILFGLMCGVAVVIVAGVLPAARPAPLSLCALAIPTLPFFVAYLSDTAVLVSVSLLLAACAAALVVGSDRTHWVGIVLSFAIAAAWLVGRSAWPVLAAVLCVLVGHALTGAHPARPGLRRLATFWIPVTVALSAGAWVAQQARLFDYLEVALRADLPRVFLPLRALVDGAPWFAVPLGATLAAVQWRMSRTRLTGAAPRLAADIAVTVLVTWIVTGFVSSLFLPLPMSAPGKPGEVYVSSVFASMAAPFRLAHHDQLLSTFFWSGMGWVDIVAPTWMLDLAIGATVAAVVWSLVQSRSDAARTLRYLTLVAGLVVALLVYAVGAAGLKYALYGRYLVGWYLLLVVTAWTAPALSSRPWWPWLVLLVAIHAFYLQSIPARYF